MPLLKQMMESFAFPTVLLTVAVAIVMLVGDQPRMERYGLNKEATFSRVTAWVYIIGAVLLWLVIQIVNGVRS